MLTCSSRIAIGASESLLLSDKASRGGGGFMVGSIITHKIVTTHMWTTDCNQKRGGGHWHCLHHST